MFVFCEKIYPYNDTLNGGKIQEEITRENIFANENKIIDKTWGGAVIMCLITEHS
jgi:hypothetical protein